MRSLIRLLVCMLGLTSTLVHAATLESPAPGANVSGLGYIAGWKCHHGEVMVRIDGGGPIRMATRMPRADTQSVCQGATDNGFIAQFNWAFLADGSHTVVAYDNGVEFARSTFTVATFGEEFVEEAEGECTITDFPSTGETARFVWNESTQHLELVGGIPPPPPPPLIGALASHGRFHVIRHELSEAQDHDAECRAQLGSGFRLADWNDIVIYHQGGGSLSAFTTRLKMVPAGEQPEPGELGNGYRISRDGNAIWSGRRHYFVARHDHNRPSHFLDHANLDNHHVSLGSWYGTGGYALCYATGGTTTPPPTFGGASIADQQYTQDTAISALTLPAATGGTGTLTYRLSPALPAGLQFDARTRRLTGTPTTTLAATLYTYTVTDANRATASLTFRLRVAGGEPGLAPADQAAWVRLVAGKRVVNVDDSADYYEFSSTGRFTYHFHGSQVSGTYSYRKTGPNTAEVAVTSDGGISCTYRATFTSATTGTAVEACTNSPSRGYVTWRILP